MKRILAIQLICLIFSIPQLTAQMLDRINFDVFHNGRQLLSPLAGGLNSPQFSKVDLNNDGIEDLYVFDKAGDLGLTFLNTSFSGEANYVYKPEYLEGFPELHAWVLMRDYDQDGIADIFAKTNVPGIPGVDVYKGYYENSRIRFKQIPTKEGAHNILYAQQANGSFVQVYVSSIDYPAIDDIDNDGDMDVVTFSQNGGLIYLYENMSMQRGFGRDSFKFERTDNCFGQLYESGVTECLSLSGRPDSCSLGFTNDTPVLRHSGSTVLTLDADNDGDKELVLGDLNFNSLNYSVNGGTVNDAWMIDQDCSFPSYDVPVRVASFPASFYLDIDGDGLKDLMAAPNLDIGRGDNYECSWLYKNTSSNENPRFSLSQKDFLTEDMIDVGSGSIPAIVDYNGDGLMDIVIGSESLFDPDRSWNPSLWLYENTGTPTNPRFILVDDDWLGFRDMVGDNNFNLAPTFGDLDNDGDLDILVGEQSGALFYGENISGPGNFMQFNTLEFNYQNIDDARLSTPTIFDLNKDGLPDLIIGENRGKLNYYQNIGTASNPKFPDDPTNTFLGQVDTRTIGSDGNTAPHFFVQNGELMLLTGTQHGTLYLYNNIEGNLDGAFNLVDSAYGEIYTGADSRFALGDLNSDDIVDIVVGNRRGGISVYSSTFATSLTELWGGADFQLFPNPASEVLHIVLPEAGQGKAVVHDLLGRQLAVMQFNGQKMQIPVHNMMAGIYILTIEMEEGTASHKFVVN